MHEFCVYGASSAASGKGLSFDGARFLVVRKRVPGKTITKEVKHAGSEFLALTVGKQ